jgi:hypothetical protein
MRGVLPGIAEIGKNRRDPPGRRAAEGIDHDQQFHQVVVGRKGGRLHHEDILAAHVFLDFDKNLLIGEAPDACLAERDIEIVANGFSQAPVRVSRENLHLGPPVVPAASRNELQCPCGRSANPFARVLAVRVANARAHCLRRLFFC